MAKLSVMMACDVHRAVVEIEEAFRLAFAHHVAGLRTRAAELGLLHRRLPLLWLQRRLAVRGARVVNRGIQRLPIVGARLGRRRQGEAGLVGVGFQMGGTGVEHRAVDQPGSDRLLDDAVEDRLRDSLVPVAAAPVLAQGRGVEHLIRQLQPQEPAIGDVDLDLAHQLPLRAHPEQVADEQRFEHQGRIERWAAVVGAVERRRRIVDEGKVDRTLDLAEQMISRNQLIQRHHLKRGLFRGGSLQHNPVKQKPPANARGLSAV